MNIKNRFIQDIMVYSYITHKKGVHHKIDNTILKLFDNILDGMGRIDGKMFSDIIFCLTDCSFQWNYTAIEPDLFYLNNWTGPILLFAYIVDGPTIICNITKSIQDLYGKKRNWNRRAHIVEFYQEFVGYNLKLIFEDYSTNYIIETYVHTFVHVNPIFVMPPSLQNRLYLEEDATHSADSSFDGHFTDINYAKIICEIHHSVISDGTI